MLSDREEIMINVLVNDKVRSERVGRRICRSRGGESCAFDGALIVLQPIADAVHLIHGPISCVANSWHYRGTISKKGEFHRMGFTTDLSELDIVLGSEDKLKETIQKIYHKFKPEAIFVYSTCVTGLFGEDIEMVCEEMKRELLIDIVPVNCPGFVGPKNLGNRIAGEVLLDYVIGGAEPEILTGREINLIGEYNVAGDQFLFEPLISKSGINILSRITGNSTYREIKYAHRAKLNVIVCSRALVNMGVEMKKRYGIPFIEVSFYGATETSRSLREIARVLGEEIIERVEKVINEEEKKLMDRLKEYSLLQGKRAVLYTGGVKSWSMISALRDLGIDVVGVGIKKSTLEDEEKIKNLVKGECILFEDTSPKNILEIMKKTKAQILIAGGRNLYLAVKEGFPFVDVNQERHRAYAGYTGLLNLAEDIQRAIKFYEKREKILPVIEEKRVSSMDPLKSSPLIGAVLSLTGVDGAIPILHTAKGCNFLGKVLLTRHFREPIPIISTDLFTEEVVMGGNEKLRQTIEAGIKKGGKLIGVITGALSHLRGDDINEVVHAFSDRDGVRVLSISAPDYSGSLQDGYKRGILGLLDLVPAGGSKRRSDQINIIAGVHLTPRDFYEIRRLVGLFGLRPIILPDLSCLEGSVGFSSVARGGVRLEEIEKMAESLCTITIGESLREVGEVFKERFDMEYYEIRSLSGIKENDRFFRILSTISGNEIPEELKRERRILIDSLRDMGFYLSQKNVALETDLVFHLQPLICEAGMNVRLAVVPENSDALSELEVERVIIGSLEDINSPFDLLISNSHAFDRAEKIGIPLYEAGFPVFHTLGYPQRITIGYRGSIETLYGMANILTRKEEQQDENQGCLCLNRWNNC